MKKTILSALALVAMASCTKENLSVVPGDGEVRICSSIATRTVANTWEAADAIGVYMVSTGGDFSTTTDANVKYTTKENDGQFTSDSPLYFPATGNVDLMAYYPYDAATDATAYNVNVVTAFDSENNAIINAQTVPAIIDLMKAEKTNVAESSAAVNMTFRHKLARIKLNIKNGDGVSAEALANLAVTLKGTDTEATYNLTKTDNAAPITLGKAVADITMLTADATGDYVKSAEAIVIPQALNGTTLTFTTSNNTYTSSLKTTAFAIGNEYIYNVTIQETTVAISSPTIDDWDDGNDSENLDALQPEAEPDPDIAFVDGSTYEIYTVEGFEAFASIVNNSVTDVTELSTKGFSSNQVARNTSANGKLMDDIDLSTVCGNSKSWIPIGNSSNTYNGVFDGDNHEISSLYINQPSLKYQALFGYIGRDATIKNLSVSGSVKGDQYVAGIVGYAKATTSVPSIFIINCSNSATVEGVTTTGYQKVGGVVGEIYGCEVNGCSNSGNISGTGDKIGGVVGSAYKTTSLTYNCSNSGIINGTGEYVGGIVGHSESIVYNCYNTNTVTGNSTVGGVVGCAKYYVYNCYNTNTVSGNSTVGGITGSSTYVGVANCYNAGSVKGGSNNTGGVVGSFTKLSGMPVFVTNCYWANDATDTEANYGIGNKSNDEGAAPMTTIEMQAGAFVTTLNASAFDYNIEFPYYRQACAWAAVQSSTPKFDFTAELTPESDTDFIQFYDENFKAALLTNEGIDTNNDSEISYKEAKDFTGDLKFSDPEITSMSDIKYFANITRLDCNGQNSGMQYLDVSNCTKLEYLLVKISSDLERLDVSNNVNLIHLECQWTNITTLDLSKNVNLIYLNCHDTKISKLDLSKNVNLTDLDCNSCTDLTTLDVSKNVNLTELNCAGCTDLTTLDVSKNVNLTGLNCAGCTDLTTLDVSNSVELVYLYCENTKISKLDVYECYDHLMLLHCYNCSIDELTLPKGTPTLTLKCYGNRLTSLDISDHSELYANHKFYSESFQIGCQTTDGSTARELTLYISDDQNNSGINTLFGDGAINENKGVITKIKE